MYGDLVTFTLEKGTTKIEVQLETEKRRLTVFGPNNLTGESYTELPEHGIFVPAILNKTAKTDRNLKMMARFDFINLQ